MFEYRISLPKIDSYYITTELIFFMINVILLLESEIIRSKKEHLKKKAEPDGEKVRKMNISLLNIFIFFLIPLLQIMIIIFLGRILFHYLNPNHEVKKREMKFTYKPIMLRLSFRYYLCFVLFRDLKVRKNIN